MYRVEGLGVDVGGLSVWWLGGGARAYARA